MKDPEVSYNSLITSWRITLLCRIHRLS